MSDDAPVVKGSPETIWLNYGDIEIDCDHSELDEVTWCADEIGPSDVRYVRGDRLDAANAELAALRADRDRLRAERDRLLKAAQDVLDDRSGVMGSVAVWAVGRKVCTALKDALAASGGEVGK